mgnify:CR=1 FL=1
MRKYYTRPCNFYYGSYARDLVKKKKAFFLAGNSNIAFDQLEIFQRKKKGIVQSNVYSINEIRFLNKKIKSTINLDLQKVISKRKNICGLKFDNPQIMGVLNVTPDSFSDGGLFLDQSKAYDQTNLMINSGAAIIDIGGESTRPNSKVVNEKEKWKRKKNVIVKLKKKLSQCCFIFGHKKIICDEKRYRMWC